MQSNTPNSLYFLFAFIIITWGLSWPVSKIGVTYIPPLWFAVGRLTIGTISMFLILAACRKLVLPKRQDLPLIISIGLLQIGFFIALTSVGLHYTGVGHAAIIVYSTPLWVTPVAILFFGETMRPLKILGLLLGLAGMFTLFNPWGFAWHDKQVVFGSFILLLSAWCWACAMLIARYSTWHNTPLALIPWQLLVGTLPITLLALYLDPHPQVEWHWSIIGIMFYIGVIVTAIGYWGTMLISKALPVMTTSLCFLAAPVLGLLSSAIFLGEPLTFNLVAAVALIITGLVCVAASNALRIRKLEGRKR